MFKIRDLFYKVIFKLIFNTKKKMQFYRIMARSTNPDRSGIMISDVLKALIDQEGNNSVMQQLYKSWSIQLSNGKKISNVIKNYVPASEAMLIAASESSRICDGFVAASEYARQKQTFKRVIFQAVVPPIAILIMGFLVLSYFCMSIIPVMAHSVPLDKLSYTSAFVLKMSDNYATWMPIILIGLILLSLITIYALPNYKSGLRKWLDDIPPFSLYRLLAGISFLQTLSALTRANLQTKESLLRMREFSSPYLRYRIDVYLKYINRGVSLGNGLIYSKLNFPDKEIIKELSMYSKYGNLEVALGDVINSLSEDGLELVAKQAAIINKVSMLFCGGLVMFLIMSLFTFIQDLLSTINF